MAVRTVIPGGGGDHSTLAAWEAFVQGTLSEIQEAECHAGADTTACAIDGSTTTSSFYLRIRAAAGAEAKMPFNTSTSYRLAVTSGVPLTVADPFTRVERIQVSIDDTSSNRTGVMVQVSDVRVLGVLVRSNTSNVNTCFRNDGNGGFFVNCVAIGNLDANSSGFESNPPNLSDVTLWYNCTAVNSGFNFLRNWGTVTARNCLGFGAVTNDFLDNGGTGWEAATSHNASEDATAPGSSSRTSQTFTFVNAGAGDYHLDGADGGAKDFAVDLSGASDWPFSNDFDGDTRSGSWDIGADEVAGGGPLVGFLGRKRVRRMRGPYDMRGFLRRRVWDYTVVAATIVQAAASGAAGSVAAAPATAIRGARASGAAVSSGSALAVSIRPAAAAGVAGSGASARGGRLRQASASGVASAAFSAVGISAQARQGLASGVAGSVAAAAGTVYKGGRASGVAGARGAAPRTAIRGGLASGAAGARGAAPSSAIRAARASACAGARGVAPSSAKRAARASGVAASFASVTTTPSTSASGVAAGVASARAKTKQPPGYLRIRLIPPRRNH